MPRPVRAPSALALAHLALAAACLLPACAGREPVARMAHPPLLPGPDPRLARYPPEIRSAIEERRVVRGMDAEAVRLAWGEPDAVERTPSAVAPGLVYERWTWRAAARVAWLAEGRVVDAISTEPTGR